MPKIPDEKVLQAKNVKLDPKAILNAVINDMHNDELEQALVDAGVAQFVENGE